MKKIKDIRVNTTSYGETYILDNQLVGRLLVDDNNSFEGIIGNSENSFLVFGKINEKLLEMIQKEKDSTKLYKVEKDGTTYYGDCFVKDGTFEYPIGESFIELMNAEEYRTLFPGEEEILEQTIKNAKK